MPGKLLLGPARGLAYTPNIAGRETPGRAARHVKEDAMKCVTGPLTSTQLLDEIPEIVKLLQATGIESLVVEYGHGCKLDADQLWRDIEIPLQDVVAFVQNSIEKGIFAPGESDLLLQDRDGSFECLLCRDSDIHLAACHEALITQATSRWIDKGYGGFRLAASEDWQPM
jgi:hypothetical protein